MQNNPKDSVGEHHEGIIINSQNDSTPRKPNQPKRLGVLLGPNVSRIAWGQKTWIVQNLEGRDFRLREM